MYFLILILFLGHTNFHVRERAHSVLKGYSANIYDLLISHYKENSDEEIKQRCKSLSEYAWTKITPDQRFKIFSEMRPAGSRKLPWFHIKYGYGYVTENYPEIAYPRWDNWRDATLRWMKDAARDGNISRADMKWILEDLWQEEMQYWRDRQ